MNRKTFLAAALAVLLLPLLPAAGKPVRGRIGVTPLQGASGVWDDTDIVHLMQDVFVTELRSAKLQAAEVIPNRRNLTLSGDIDPATRKSLRSKGYRYVLVPVVTGQRPGRGRGRGRGRGNSASPVLNARLIDTSTGEVVWLKREPLGVSVFGLGGGVDDNRRRAALRPPVRRLVASLKSADL